MRSCPWASITTAAASYETVATEVHENLKPTFNSETHACNWLQSLKTYVIPVFGNKAVDNIDSADALKAIGPIWNEVPDTATRTLRCIKSVFDYCMVKGYRKVTVNGVAMTLRIRAERPSVARLFGWICRYSISRNGTPTL